MRLKKARQPASKGPRGNAEVEGRAAVRDAEDYVASAWLASIRDDEAEARTAVAVCIRLRKRMLRVLSAAEQSGDLHGIAEARNGLAGVEEALDMSRATLGRVRRLLDQESFERAEVVRRHAIEAQEDEQLSCRPRGFRRLRRCRGQVGAVLLATICGHRTGSECGQGPLRRRRRRPAEGAAAPGPHLS